MSARSQQLTNPSEAQPAGAVVMLFGTSGNSEFSCALADWNFIIELGQTFGWHPAGTTYLPQQGQRARLNPIKHDYQPGDSQDSKRVEANDSESWSAALDGAKRSPFFSDMVRKHSQQQAGSASNAEHSLLALLQRFIEFSRRGAFTIALQNVP